MPYAHAAGAVGEFYMDEQDGRDFMYQKQDAPDVWDLGDYRVALTPALGVSSAAWLGHWARFAWMDGMDGISVR